ncbi:MAG: hypothetical protein ACJAQW_002115, partial [Paracoccaceae bacterium]
ATLRSCDFDRVDLNAKKLFAQRQGSAGAHA